MVRTYLVWRTVSDDERNDHVEPDVFDGPMLVLVGYIDANGAEQAIRKARDGRVADRDGEIVSYHAIPERNWTTISAVTEIPAPRVLFTQGELPMFDVKRPRPEPVDDTDPRNRDDNPHPDAEEAT